ncbi:molybdenum cofactor biosynthesis protein MoaE [Hyphomicrobium zavarzinii]|uniref:molybdenum cofactor biosynthesis protein MoaE n=1 Tax=Hyphomicrobium zavarzinii TaxID=48292 RepID=UPI000372C352|nr:molybdenum cofactor biosynthesis protein MoaE [Hyphomicrobium zavarzinii]
MGSASARLDVNVHQGPLDKRLVSELALEGDAGAVLTFAGVVRNLNLGRPVVALEYDCAPDLARRVLMSIATEALDRWNLRLVSVHHGYGRVNVGEVGVLIAVGAARRNEAYEASRYLIEEVKRRAPVWKCEVYADGERAWLEGTPLPEARGRGGSIA